MSTEERLIERLHEASPGATALAEAVSFAVLVEPQLLRRARLELLTNVDVGAEADLWLSRIVQSRGPEGIVLLPRAAELLRLRLAARAGQPDLLERAWRLTSELHAHLPVTLRFEEEINRLSVNPDDLALSRIESLLQSIAGTLVQDKERRGLASWAARALPRLPEAIRRLEPARVLAMASYLRLGAALPIEESRSDDELPEWVAWALPKDLPTFRLDARLVAGGVEFGPPTDAEHVIEVPATNPLLVEMSWTEGGLRRVKQVSLKQGERMRFDAPFTEITLRTVLGDRYTITPLPEAVGEEQESKVMQQNRPLCYVAMPFGQKTDYQTGRMIDFDVIYHQLIRPAVEQAGLEPSRADEVASSGPIEKYIFERLIFSEYV
ncbi:MAG: hypothetical protein LC802_09330, partial [Acidobacteria bacterium]|nr:hypothetical protein [Acidobacteriota bacterium]